MLNQWKPFQRFKKNSSLAQQIFNNSPLVPHQLTTRTDFISFRLSPQVCPGWLLRTQDLLNAFQFSCKIKNFVLKPSSQNHTPTSYCSHHWSWTLSLKLLLLTSGFMTQASLVAQLVKNPPTAGDPGSIPRLSKSPGEGVDYPLQYSWASLVTQVGKNSLAMWETWVPSLGWQDPLEEGMATHSNILTWRIPMDRGAGGLQSTGSQRIGQSEQLSRHRTRQVLSIVTHSGI